MGAKKESLLDNIVEYVNDLMPGGEKEVRHDKPQHKNDELFDRHMQQTDAADEDFDMRLPSNEPRPPKEDEKKEE